VLVAALFLGFGPFVEAQGDRQSKPRGKGAPHVDSRSVPDEERQWSADPERGWVRAEENRKPDGGRQQAESTKARKGRDKGQDVKDGAILQDY
jgi:hypothetical protein